MTLGNYSPIFFFLWVAHCFCNIPSSLGQRRRMNGDYCTICYKQVQDSHALYCSAECANVDNSTQMNSNNTPPPSPSIHLRFSIAITPNIYHASEANAKVLSPPSSVASSFTDSSDSLLTDAYALDDNFDDCEEETFDSEYYPSVYSTSNPIDIPRTQTTNDSVLPLNKATFGED